jgi:glycine/sarcosine N-methyltransferase
MSESAESFYDDLAQYYDLIFEDWDRSIIRQADVLGPILERAVGKISPYVLDCACGIGTQALGLAQRGHTLVGADLSRSAIARARIEAQQRHLDARFYVADMRDLSGVSESGFDAILVADNALPHLLSQAELQSAIVAMAAKLADSGVLVATIRDYDSLLVERPATQPPAFYEQQEQRRIVHQVWDWHGDEYVVHLYITMSMDGRWVVKHFSSRYRALQRMDVDKALHGAGFDEVEWLEPVVTSFYQPIVIAKKSGVSKKNG